MVEGTVLGTYRFHRYKTDREEDEVDLEQVTLVVQRPAAKRFRPRDETDPDFGKALRAAYAKGVEIIAYRTTLDGVTHLDPQRIQTDLRTR